MIKYSLYSLMGSLSFLLLFIAGYSTSFTIFGSFLPPGGGENTRIGKFGRKYWRELIGLSFLLIVIISMLIPNPWKWFVIAFLITMYNAPLSHLKVVIELLPNPFIRGIVLTLFLFIAGISFSYAKYEAYLVKNGHGHQLINIERSKLALQADEKHPVVYLGHLSGYLALYESKSGSVVLMKFKGDEQIFFINNPKSN